MRMPPKLIHLNIRSSVSRTVWEGSEDVVLLDKLYHLEWTFRFEKPIPLPFWSLCLVLVDQDMNPQLLL